MVSFLEFMLRLGAISKAIENKIHSVTIHRENNNGQQISLNSYEFNQLNSVPNTKPDKT